MYITYKLYDIVSGYIGNSDTYIITSYKNNDTDFFYKLEFNILFNNTIYWFNNIYYCNKLQQIIDLLKFNGSSSKFIDKYKYEITAINLTTNCTKIYNKQLTDILVSTDSDGDFNAIYEINTYQNINLNEPIKIFRENSVPFPSNLI